MIFIMYISSLFALSVLLASTVLIIWSLRKEGEGILLAKIVGLTVFVLSLLSIFGIMYFKVIYWKQGYFESPMVMSLMSQKKDRTQLHEKMIKRLEQLRGLRKQNLEKMKDMKQTPASESSQEGKKRATNPQ